MRTAMAPDARDATEALEAVFREYAPLIYRTARAITGSTEDAEDIVQTIFLRLLHGDYAANVPRNPRAYLHQAAVNLALDVMRRRQRRTFIHDMDRLESPAPSGTDFGGLQHERLDAALAALEPEAVHILFLRYAHGYNDAEIAGLLGTSRGAVTLRLFRVRRRLRKLMASAKPAAPKHGEER
jgi:RNA polymerase sigma factor (sigma-70 family)